MINGSDFNFALRKLLVDVISRIVLYLTDGFLIAGAGLIVPIFAVFVQRIGGGLVEVGIAASTFSFTAGVGIFIISRLEDIHKRMLPIFVVFGYFLAMVGYFGYMFVDSVFGLYIAQIILGIAAAIRVPSYDALISRNSPHHLTVAWGNWNAVAYIVSSVSAVSGATIASSFGFETLLFVMFSLSVLAFVISLLLLRLGTESRAKEQKNNVHSLHSEDVNKS